MIASYYIDESGNTGTDWLNSDQPYFIYGGWLISQNKKHEVETFLQSVLNSQQGNELKSKNIFRRKNGFSVFNKIFTEMIDFGAVPFFGLTEKRFMIAAKIVETFFDCEYNPYVNAYLTYPIELKRALASCIAEDQEIIIRFSSLIKCGTISTDDMAIINSDLINCFKRHNQMEVVKSLINLNNNNFISMIDEFESITNNGTTKCRMTLTGTMLIELFKNIQFFAFKSGMQVNVYHDKLRGYDQEFSDLCEIFLKSGTPILLDNEYRPWLSNFPSIESFTTLDSKNEIIIQAADLLCGYISNIAKQIDNNISLDKDIINPFHTLVLLRDMFYERCKPCLVWNWYASYQFEYSFFNALGAKGIEPVDYNVLIKRDFLKALN